MGTTLIITLQNAAGKFHKLIVVDETGEKLGFKGSSVKVGNKSIREYTDLYFSDDKIIDINFIGGTIKHVK